MQRFKFPLEAALGLRERNIEIEQVRLRAIQAEWNAQQARQAELDEEVRAAEKALQGAGNPLTAGDLVALDRYRTAAHRTRLRLAQEATAIGVRLARQQAALRNAERDLRLLERLKEKAKSRWQQEFDKEQQQLAEEAYLSRWNAR